MKTTQLILALGVLFANGLIASGEKCTATISCDGKGNGKWVFNMDFCSSYFHSLGDPAAICKCVPYADRPKNIPPPRPGEAPSAQYCPAGTPPPGGMPVPPH